MLPDWAISLLRCPETGQRLELRGGALVREDGKVFPCPGGIASLVYPETLQDKDASWNRFYDALAPFYDFSERILGRLLTGVDMVKGRGGDRRSSRVTKFIPHLITRIDLITDRLSVWDFPLVIGALLELTETKFQEFVHGWQRQSQRRLSDDFPVFPKIEMVDGQRLFPLDGNCCGVTVGRGVRPALVQGVSISRDCRVCPDKNLVSCFGKTGRRWRGQRENHKRQSDQPFDHACRWMRHRSSAQSKKFKTENK